MAKVILGGDRIVALLDNGTLLIGREHYRDGAWQPWRDEGVTLGTDETEILRALLSGTHTEADDGE